MALNDSSMDIDTLELLHPLGIDIDYFPYNFAVIPKPSHGMQVSLVVYDRFWQNILWVWQNVQTEYSAVTYNAPLKCNEAAIIHSMRMSQWHTIRMEYWKFWQFWQNIQDPERIFCSKAL